MEPPKLPPLARPVPWTYDPTFVPVSARERESFDLTAETTFNVLCQWCENLLRKSPKLPEIPLFTEDSSTIPIEGQIEIDESLLRDSALGGCYLCTLVLRETQRSYGATEKTPPFRSVAPYVVWSRLVAPVDQGIAGDMDEGFEDDYTYGSTHGVTLATRHEGGNFYSTFLIQHPRTSEPPSAFCRSIYTGSDECLERCRVWLQDCLESHSECHHSLPSKVPTRLIEIMNPREIRLVEPTNKVHYFVLSYCWGGSDVLKSTTESLAAFKSSIPFDQLALTIQDAIGVAYRLGSRFLWVDSLCILQDDAQDWQREAKGMCDVYRNATLTIAALGAARATDGLFARRDPLIFQGCQFYRTWNQSPDRSHHSPSVVNQYACFSSSTLNSRGWTFQERALSRRTLYFGSSIFWECNSKLETEGKLNYGGLEAHFKALVFPVVKGSPVLQQPHQDDTLDTTASKTLQAWPALKKWDKILIDYTIRNLTYPSDRLPAIAGLIAHYSQLMNWTNNWGLWKDHLTIELLWKVFSNTRGPHRNTAWPTWSWISIQSQVSLGGRFEGFLAEARFDELDDSAVILHGVPFEISELDPQTYNSLEADTRKRKKGLSSIEWDTTDTNLAGRPFGVPLTWAYLREHSQPNSDRVILNGLCLVADGSTGSYRRCGSIFFDTNKTTARQYDIRFQSKQVFRIV